MYSKTAVIVSDIDIIWPMEVSIHGLLYLSMDEAEDSVVKMIDTNVEEDAVEAYDLCNTVIV